MSDVIIDFTRNVWRTCFPQNKRAPKSLCYDPLSSMTGAHYGLAHIAHDSIYMDNFMHDPDFDYEPDDQIYAIDPYNRETYPSGPQDITVSDIPKLPLLECILFISFDNMENVQLALEKLDSNGVVIIINECVKLPEEWIPLNIDIEHQFGGSISFYLNNNKNRRPQDILKSIKAFIKSN